MAFDTKANETEDTMLQLRHVNQWVRDQDEALAFYTEKLGLELRDDVTVPEMGNFRWLTVGPVGQPDVAVVLMAIPGPPVFDEATAAKLHRADGQGRRRRPLLRDRRRPGGLRGAQGEGRRVHATSRWSGPTASMPASATRPGTRSG